MNQDEERRLLLDLVAAALSALETGRKVSSRAVALTRVLNDKGVATTEEVERVELAYARIGLIPDKPELGHHLDQWNSLIERLRDAHRRLSDEVSE